MVNMNSEQQKYERLTLKYKKSANCWAIFDVIEQFIEEIEGDSFLVTMDEIKNEIFCCDFEPGLPQLHRDLVQLDPEFVWYVFEGAKAELESTGFIFTEISAGNWRVTRPNK